MRLVIVSVGRWKSGPERELFARYVERCPWRIDLLELVLKRTAPASGLRAAEAELMLPHVAGPAPVVVLDERGRLQSSADIAQSLGEWRDRAAGPVRFVVGGADGVEPRLSERADAVWSFGRVTWPHLLVRVLLAEQLYRAASILAGHPYHRDG
jgi:23S rRNA (pseudouridine1915-N3)-methyltransferase